MAFGKWEAYKLTGSPYVDGAEKVYLTNPELAIIRDRPNKRMGLVVNRVKGTDSFFLPKHKASVAKPVYYAIYSPIEEWIHNTNGYAPLPGSDALKLVHHLVPEHFTLLAKAEDEEMFNHFPLSYRQMILHASRLEHTPIETYLDSLPEQHQEKARESFRLDVPASQ